MKILVLTTTFPRWHNDKIPMFVYDLSRILSSKGAQITVVSPHHKGAKKYEIIENITVQRFSYFYPATCQRLAYEGGILSNIKRSTLAKIQVPLLFISQLYSVCRLLKKERIDVIHSHWIIPNGVIGAIASKFFGVKHALTIHAADLFILEKLPLGNHVIHFVLRYSDKVAAINSDIYARLKELVSAWGLWDSEERIKIIPMGVDSALYTDRKDKLSLRKRYNVNAKTVVLFMGRLVEKKGLLYLLEGIKKMIDLNEDVELIICGEGPLENALTRKAHEYGLERVVRFTGYIDGEKKRDYFYLSDILIVPSIITTMGDREGLPVVILEGLACGLPVVATNVGGIKDVIRNGENGFLIEQKNPDQIAEKIALLAHDEKLKAGLSAKAARTVQRYDWSVIGSQYYDLLYTMA